MTKYSPDGTERYTVIAPAGPASEIVLKIAVVMIVQAPLFAGSEIWISLLLRTQHSVKTLILECMKG